MIIEYQRPGNLQEASILLARKDPLSVPMGGGIYLSHISYPDFAVVDLQSLGLNKLEKDDKHLHIGATVTLQQLLDDEEHLPSVFCDSFRDCIKHEAPINIRNTATIAGNIVCGDGRSPFAAALLALDAKLEFFPDVGHLKFGDFLVLRDPFNYLPFIAKVLLPLTPKLHVDIVSRTPKDRPIVCVAVATWPSGRTRIALGGHGLAPVLAMDSPDITGSVVATEEAFRFAEDEWGSAAYRMDVAAKLVRRIISLDRGRIE